MSSRGETVRDHSSGAAVGVCPGVPVLAELVAGSVRRGPARQGGGWAGRPPEACRFRGRESRRDRWPGGALVGRLLFLVAAGLGQLP